MTQHSTRWTVIRRAANGETEDQALFVRRYGPVIRAYLGARWRGTPLFEEVADGAQQVLLDCFKDGGALQRADPNRSFRGFLYGVVRNVARDFERKAARRKARQSASGIDLDAVSSREESCARIFDRAWASALLRDAAELQRERAVQLGPEALQRHDLLQLRYGEGLPIREIADRWNVDAERLHRAYPKAREEFKRALFDVVRDLQGGEHRSIEKECARLLEIFS